jgi:hypothetical protein
MCVRSVLPNSLKPTGSHASNNVTVPLSRRSEIFWRKMWSCLCDRLWRSIELWNVEDLVFSWQPAHRWRWGFHSYVLAALYAQRNTWYSELSRSQNHCTAGRIKSIEKSNDVIGNRSRDLLTLLAKFLNLLRYHVPLITDLSPCVSNNVSFLRREGNDWMLNSVSSWQFRLTKWLL